MNYIYAPNYETLGQLAARYVAKEILINPSAVLGLPTGSTPISMYNYLVKLFKEGLISFSQVKTFNLDEYIGISPEHSQSYHTFMHQHFWDFVDLPVENRNIPYGHAVNLYEECIRYDNCLEKAGGIDLQILGIGLNGHIGFNEPSHNLEIRTHIVNLTSETIHSNSKFFNNIYEVPKKAITMGIGSIMQSRKILLLVSGQNKKDILEKTLYGPITTEVPASILQLHTDLTVISDIPLNR